MNQHGSRNGGGELYDSKAANWSNAEVEKLIQIWSEPQMQIDMDSTYRNFFVFEKISQRLTELGMDRTAAQCRVKIKNLKSIYTRLKETSPDELEKLKMRNPAMCVVESVLTQKYNEIDGATTEVDDSLSNQGPYVKIENVVSNDDEDDGDDDGDEEEENYNEHEEEFSSSTNNIPEIQVRNPVIEMKDTEIRNLILANRAKKRKRPPYEMRSQDYSFENGATNMTNTNSVKHFTLEMVINKMSKLEETFVESMSALQKQLREERKFYMECEERRLKFFAELEEKRRRDEREHELKLFQLFTGIQRNSNSNTEPTSATTSFNVRPSEENS